MGKDVRFELRYDGATPEQVYAMLADPEFRDQVCEFQRYPRREVTITPTGAGMDVKVDQYRPATEVPSFARKLVGEELNIVQTESWSSPTSAALHVTIPGKPGDMKGTVTLTAADGGTTEVVQVTVKASIPLIGGKIESLIGDMLGKALRAENKVGRDWLAR
ncbi:DUF2505 domain-containing protein [Nocardioides marmoriginsengisoli]|uniref:DUF2505 domain-containing protein n=1 Tax=Nocardioides marmoriginsengisoli TaxID=661483 RepID=A0A3N0CJF5_9ACTN|nr:DUF2505 domain-containing protein [Nocardioides marmoriginsengisoli]RNL63073.1 DUF2505 domain-containing protein [Nocardioides marmoriginsengisoli]